MSVGSAKSHEQFVDGQQAGYIKWRQTIIDFRQVNYLRRVSTHYKKFKICRSSLNFRKIWRGNQELLFLGLYYST